MAMHRIAHASDVPVNPYGGDGRLMEFAAGDVVVVSAAALTDTPFYFYVGEPGQTPSVAAEPVYFVSEAFFNAVAPDTATPAGRAVLSDALTGADTSRVGAKLPAALSALRVDQINFRQGAWVVGGFDFTITGAEQTGIVLSQYVGGGGAAAVTLAGNRFTTREHDGTWLRDDADGHLVNIRTGNAQDCRVVNNLFEACKGSVCVFVGPQSPGSVVERNTFRDCPPKGSNGAEAGHMGFVTSDYWVSSPNDPPVYENLGAIFQQNLLLRYDGESEAVGSKVGHNVIRDNWIVDCAGGISLRDGEFATVEGNVVVRSRGIRVLGRNHTLTRNTVIHPSAPGPGLYAEAGAAAATPSGTPGLLRWVYTVASGLTASGNRVALSPGANLADAVAEIGVGQAFSADDGTAHTRTVSAAAATTDLETGTLSWYTP